MPEHNTIIGENLKALRTKREYTQVYLAKYLNCSRDMYLKIESGYSELTTTKLLKLCKIYRVSPNLILKGSY